MIAEQIRSSVTSAPAPKPVSSGFFQFSIDFLRRLAVMAGPREMATYLVLCGGVDGRRKERLCTHGALSVSSRTGMSYRQSQLAIEWLQRYGLVREPGPGDPRHLSPRSTRATQVQWVIEDQGPYLALSRQFLDGVGDTSSGALRRVMEEIRCSDQISTIESQRDALLLYAALMREQDFGDWAGVRPTVWHEIFEPVIADEIPGAAGNDIPGTNGVLVEVEASGEEYVDLDFVRSVFPIYGEPDDFLRMRFDHAVNELLRLGLIYRAVVIWEGDPRTEESLSQSNPMATLYINDSWARSIDPCIQPDVHRAIWRTGADCESLDFDKKGQLDVMNQHVYRYIVRSGTEHRNTVIRQLRVRFWAAGDAVVKGRQREQSRTERWQKALNDLCRQSPIKSLSGAR